MGKCPVLLSGCRGHTKFLLLKGPNGNISHRWKSLALQSFSSARPKMWPLAASAATDCPMPLPVPMTQACIAVPMAQHPSPVCLGLSLLSGARSMVCCLSPSCSSLSSKIQSTDRNIMEFFLQTLPYPFSPLFVSSCMLSDPKQDTRLCQSRCPHGRFAHHFQLKVEGCTRPLLRSRLGHRPPAVKELPDEVGIFRC